MIAFNGHRLVRLKPPTSSWELTALTANLGFMKDYRKGSHSVFNIHIHLVWSTKYRRKVLKKEAGKRLRQLIRQYCSDMRVEILSGVIAKEHVHVSVSLPPQVSVSKLVQKLKGKTSYKLQ